MPQIIVQFNEDTNEGIEEDVYKFKKSKADIVRDIVDDYYSEKRKRGV